MKLLTTTVIATMMAPMAFAGETVKEGVFSVLKGDKPTNSLPLFLS